MVGSDRQESVTIPINGGSVIVDAADADYVRRFRWHLVTRDAGKGRSVRSKTQGLLGRALLGRTSGDRTVVRHINGDPFDFRRSNLVAVSTAERNNGRRSWGATGVSGVFRDARTGLFQVRLRRDGRLLQLW